MAAALLMLGLFFIIGILTLLINAVIAPDWLDWAQFACCSMLFPLSLHFDTAMIPILLFWSFTALSVIADAIVFYRVRKNGGKTGKHLLRLWLTPTVAFLFFIICSIEEVIGHV